MFWNFRKKKIGPSFVYCESTPRHVCFFLFLAIALGLMGCAATTVPGGHNWPKSGVVEFCKGNEPLAVGVEAARRAERIKPRGSAIRGAAGYKDFAKKRELRDKAQCIFSAHAGRGDVHGKYLLGLTYLAQASRGSTTDFRQPPNSSKEGLRLLKEAALKGHGKAFLRSLKVRAQRRKGYNEWIKQAAAAGNHEAQYELGEAHLDPRTRPGIPGDAKAAVHWLTLSARHGNVFAASKLGSLYAKGAPGVEKDAKEAIRWLEPLLERPQTRREGSVLLPPYLRLARLYCAVGDRDKALTMFQRGYNVGDAEARSILARECR